MLYILDAIRSLATSFVNAMRPPTTVDFPTVIRPRTERFRTGFALLHGADGDELCIGCKACARICPSDVITVELDKRKSPVTGKERGYASAFTLDLNACIFCELCVQVCPPDALVMTRIAEKPEFTREALVLDLERLYRNEKERPHAWATASRLGAMQTGEKPADEGGKHA